VLKLRFISPIMVDDFQNLVKFWEEIWWIAMAFVKSESRVLFVKDWFRSFKLSGNVGLWLLVRE
jgi:hypothetical protein